MRTDPLKSLQAICQELRTLYRADSVQPEVAQLAIERLWIFAGEAAKHYVRDNEVDDRRYWGWMIAFRDKLAHLLPEQVDAALVWAAEADLDGWVSDLVSSALDGPHGR